MNEGYALLPAIEAHPEEDTPRLAFADIMVPHQGPAAQAIEVALRMLEAGVDAVGVHLQADARHPLAPRSPASR